MKRVVRRGRAERHRSDGAWALAHPDDVRSLVLLAGYYCPTACVDALLTVPVALPLLGDAMC